jgi:hypothetical protein
MFYDAIPAGKKPVLDAETGEWKLVDLDKTKPEDAVIMLSELRALHKELEGDYKTLQATYERLKIEHEKLKNALPDTKAKK